MKTISWAVILLAAFLIPSVHGLSTPTDKVLIPATISPSSSFILYPEYSEPGSIRITWDVKVNSTLCPFGRTGSFYKSGDKWLCYFSNTDESSTCGPSPFTGCVGNNVYVMEFFVSDAAGNMANQTFNIPVGDVELITDINQENGNIFMEVCPQGAPSSIVSYGIYSTNLTSLQTGFLDKFIQTGCYLGNITLDAGDYYLSFDAVQTSPIKYGGDLKILTVEVEEPIDTNGGSSDIEVTFPSKTVVIGTSTSTIELGTIKNTGNKTYNNLSVVVPDDIKGKLALIPQKKSIGPQGTVRFTMMLSNIDSSIHILTDGELFSKDDQGQDELIATIPINIKVTRIIEGVSSTDALGITPDPIITGDYLTGSTRGVTKTFSLTNNGDQALTSTDFSSTTSGTIPTDITIEFPALINIGSTSQLKVTMTSLGARNYKGAITIQNPVGSKEIYVDIDFFTSINSLLGTSRTNFASVIGQMSSTQISDLQQTLDDINETFDLAETQSTSDPRGAEATLAKANSMVDILEESFGFSDGPPPGSYCGDGTCDSDEDSTTCPSDCEEEPPESDFMGLIITIAIVFVILITIVIVYMFIKGRKTAGGEEEFEEPEEYGEEFEEIPE